MRFGRVPGNLAGGEPGLQVKGGTGGCDAGPPNNRLGVLTMLISNILDGNGNQATSAARPRLRTGRWFAHNGSRYSSGRSRPAISTSG
jgi:hypothetical protein